MDIDNVMWGERIPKGNGKFEQEIHIPMSEEEYKTAICMMYDSKTLNAYLKKTFKEERYEEFPIILSTIKERRNCKINLIFPPYKSKKQSE